MIGRNNEMNKCKTTVFKCLVGTQMMYWCSKNFPCDLSQNPHLNFFNNKTNFVNFMHVIHGFLMSGKH